ncbi:hypothetical protein ACLB2K_067929 [Fragaria x ananassa]
MRSSKRPSATRSRLSKRFEAMNEATIQTLESRISLTQEEVSAVGSELEALKNKEAAARDEFMSQMFELNFKIRKFQESIAAKILEENYMEIEAGDDGHELVRGVISEVSLRELEEMLACVVSETAKVEEEYKSEQNIQKQVQQELIDREGKVFLMEETLNATKELQDLTRYPFQDCSGYQNYSIFSTIYSSRTWNIHSPKKIIVLVYKFSES